MILKLNYFKINFSKNKIDLPFIEFKGYSELVALRTQYPNSIFIRDRDKIFFINNHGIPTNNIETINLNSYLFSNIIAGCVLQQFYKDKENYSVAKNFHLFEIKQRKSDISNGKFQGIVLLKTFSLHFFPLKFHAENLSGFTISPSIKREIIFSRTDFIKNNVSTEGLFFYETGKVRNNNESIYRIANHFKYTSELKNENDKFHSIENQKKELNNFNKEILKGVFEKIILPDDLKIQKTEILPFDSYDLLQKPQYFYYNSRFPESDNNFANRRKISFNKPFSYDQFENREIKINIIYPKDYETDVTNFFNDVKKELIYTFKLNENNIQVIRKKIDNFSLKAYQIILNEIKAVDLVCILVDKNHESLPIPNSPYYFCKAEFLKRGTNTQEFQIQQIKKYLSNKQSNFTVHNIALNIYAKLGGTAWTIKPKEPKNELVIGIGATTDKYGNPILGLTSIFRGDGKYLLGKTYSVTGMDNYRESLEKILLDSLNKFIQDGILETDKMIYLIFHIFKPAGKDNEIKALKSVLDKFSDHSFQYAFVHIGRDHNYRIFPSGNEGKALQENQRGAFIPVNPSLAFLHLKPKKSIPLKIEIHRESNFTDLKYIANQVYQFTEMSHTSYNLSGEPITIKYPNEMAKFAEKFKEGNLMYSENTEISIPDNSLWFI